MKPLRVAKALLPPAVILVVHLSAISGNHHIIPLLMVVALCAYAVVIAVSGGGWKSVAFIAAPAAALAGLQIFIFLGGDSSFVRAVFMTPVLVQGWLSWVFARSLLPGRRPLLQRISRLHRNPFPPELESYTYYLTVFWSVLLASLTVVALISGLTAEPATWSWLVNIGIPLFLALVFLLEHGYRGIAFRHLGGNSPLTTLKVLLRPESWIAP